MELQEKIVLRIGNNSYDVKFPDTGALIDLEQKKSKLSPPSSNNASIWAYQLGIAIITFETLIPNLKDDMNVKSFDRLKIEESRNLVKVYLEQFKPWFDGWIKLFDAIFEEEPTNNSK